MRRALTYHLILAVAVGPLLCCCSAGKVSAEPRPASHQSRVPAGRAAAPCCSHKHDDAKPDPVRSPNPATPDKPADKCPCKDGSDKAPTVQAGPTHLDLSTFLRTLSLDPRPSFATTAVRDVLAPGVHGPDGGRCPDHHVPTTADLLYAHHNLRC